MSLKIIFFIILVSWADPDEMYLKWTLNPGLLNIIMYQCRAFSLERVNAIL